MHGPVWKSLLHCQTIKERATGKKKKFRSEMRPTMLDLRRLEVEVEVLKTRPSLFFICRMDLNFTSFCRRKESEAWKAWEGKGNMK